MSIDIEVMMDKVMRAVYGEKAVSSGNVSLADILKAHKTVEEGAQSLLAILKPQERQIIEMSFGLEDGNFRSPEEISAELGLNEEEIASICNFAIIKMRRRSDLLIKS